MTKPIERKLTTIFAADAAGFSREMGRDEVATVESLRRAKDVFFRSIQLHGGRVANTAGDGLIAEFPSVVEAVTCAIEVQRELEDRQILLRFRIGLHLGDVIVDGQDLLGDGVNLAARLQEMAEPGTILLSQQVFDQVQSKLTVGFEFIGDETPHNFPSEIPIYRVAGSQRTVRVAKTRNGRPSRGAAPSGADPTGAAPSSGADPSGTAATVSPTPVARTALTIGAAWVFLFIIDVASGPGWFAHWVLIPILAALAVMTAPRIARNPWQIMALRSGAICVALVLINLFSWSGTFWAIYPIAGLGLALTLRLLSKA